MASPPPSQAGQSELPFLISLAFELGGASRVTGGVLRGRAHGNVFNHADADEAIWLLRWERFKFL